MSKKLLILHIDGLSHKRLTKGIKKGYLPTIKKLVEKKGYSPVRYRTGVPPTTPFAQAGILYGDNDNIPSFTWFDKKTGVVVRFGTLSTFKKVAHKYFVGKTPLTQLGATIAACYPAGALETFALAYNDVKSPTTTKKYARFSVMRRWISNPLHIINWLIFSVLLLMAYALRALKSKAWGDEVAHKYFLTYLAQEIFLHHMTRFATVQAMKVGYPSIYSAFYAYDDAAHAFGPDNKFCINMMRQLDQTINYIIKNIPKDAPYELLILSDHGQIPTIPFVKKRGKSLGEVLSDWYPTYDISETPGNHITPREQFQDGEIIMTYSGGLAHLYIRHIQGRATLSNIKENFPDLIDRLRKMPEIDCILIKDYKRDLLITKDKIFQLGRKKDKQLLKYLSKFDNPEILRKQLLRFNSFESAGDIVIFGKYSRGVQINFENQWGGHGAIGGDQMHPFLLVKKRWKMRTSKLDGAHLVYKAIKDMTL
jgi:predicted AlkP superfamily pyrophosphatase or phosphodiesterase